MDVINKNTRDKVYGIASAFCIPNILHDYIAVAAGTHNNIVTFTSFTDKPTRGDSFEWNTYVKRIKLSFNILNQYNFLRFFII